MVLSVLFKTPDVMDHVLETIEDEDQRMEAEEFMKQYIYYSEYVQLEFDTKKKTAKVMKH